MFKTLWGEVGRGRLRRLPFLGWYLLIVVIVLLGSFAVGASVGVAEQGAGGDMAAVQARVAEQFGVLGTVLILVLFVVLLFAQLNITAKRFRDIGLPGWIVLLGVLIISGLLGAFVGQGISVGFNLLVLLALLLVPSDVLGLRGV